MLITATDLTTLTFTPIQATDEVTQRVFTATHTVSGEEHEYLVLVHIDKQHNDTDGDGTIDTLDGKFCLSLINNNGEPILVNDKPIKISQVHSVSVESINDGTTDIVDWVTEISNQLIPIVVNKKATLASWGSV